VRSFASDNNAGAHPDVLDALGAANVDHAPAYGADEWTERAERCLRAEFGEQARGFPVWGGTAANVLAIRSTCRAWEGVACSDVAHIQVHEAGAPERIAGVKLYPLPAPDGKLRAQQLDPLLAGSGDEHAVQCDSCRSLRRPSSGAPTRRSSCARSAITRTSSGCSCTSTGRVSRTPPRISICRCARSQPTLASMSSPSVRRSSEHLVRRLSSSCARPRRRLRFSAQADGAAGLKDALRLGATGSALHRRALASPRSACKRDGEPPRGGRPDGRGRSNYPAGRVKPGFRDAAGPRDRAAPGKFPFYVWDASRAEVRWVCSWDTRPEDVDDLVAALRLASG